VHLLLCSFNMLFWHALTSLTLLHVS